MTGGALFALHQFSASYIIEANDPATFYLHSKAGLVILPHHIFVYITQRQDVLSVRQTSIRSNQQRLLARVAVPFPRSWTCTVPPTPPLNQYIADPRGFLAGFVASRCRIQARLPQTSFPRACNCCTCWSLLCLARYLGHLEIFPFGHLYCPSRSSPFSIIEIISVIRPKIYPHTTQVWWRI